MPNFNRLFTTLLRGSHPSFWGNWALDLNVQPGAAGILSPDGTFSFAGQLAAGPNDVVTRSANFTWKFSSSNVDVKTATFDLSGGVHPPTGASGKVGLTVTWKFSKAESMISQFAQVKEATLAAPVAFIQGQRAQIAALASGVGALTSKGTIAQGFGVVTDVYQSQNGLNVGSVSDQSSFSLTGELSAVQAMIGLNATANAGYTSTDQSQQVDEHVWPSSPTTVPPPPPGGAVPVAFKFATFEGDLILLNWSAPFQSLQLQIDNHGTYIAHARVTYTSTSAGGAQEQFLTLTGGLSRGVDLPLDARDVLVTTTFTGTTQGHQFPFPEPLDQWLPSRRCLITLGGIAPGGVQYAVTFP